MKRIVILTGSELRHTYFRKKISISDKILVLKTFCEGIEKSLQSRVKSNKNSSEIELLHVESRTKSELDYFGDYINETEDFSNPEFIKKGSINDNQVVEQIYNLNPDLIICYGSSIIKSSLLDDFKGRFLNVHLGLSPYYRGSGTNVWPIIDDRLDLIGATFMYIDKGIDTGQVIHQIQAKIFLGDGPHSIGNRLIKDMTEEFKKIIIGFDNLTPEKQVKSTTDKFVKRSDFNKEACENLYKGLNDKISNFLINGASSEIQLVTNKGLNR